MKKNIILTIIVIVVSILFTSPTFASPLIGIDTDPLTPGRQTSLDVLVGDIFTVNVMVEGIEAASPLAAFQFDIAFDPTLLDSLSVTSAGSLPSPVISSFGLDPEIRFAETSLSFLGPFPYGDFVLASVSFESIDLGTTILDLNDTILSDASALSIDHNVSDGSVNVVPVPASILLFGSGLIGLAGFNRKKIKT